MVIRVAKAVGRMRRDLAVGSAAAIAIGVAVFGVPVDVDPVAAVAAQQQVDTRAFMKQYCVSCHTQQAKQRGTVPVTLDDLDPTNVSRDARTWEQVVRKMRAGLMPPSGMPRADKATHDRFLTVIEGELDRVARANPNPGRTEAFHRLNRKQYQNAVRDLLNLDIDVTALLPADDASYGFDNIAGVLRISPTLMERYLIAAQKISRTAVGLPPSSPNIDYFRVADDRTQEDRLPDQLFGTRGGASIKYTFPMDAHYTIRVELSRDLNEQVPIYQEAQQLEVSIDGERINVFTLPGVAGPPPPPPSEPVAASDVPADDSAATAAPTRGRGAGADVTQRGGGAGARRGGGGGNRQGQAQRNRADKDWEVRVPVKAGPHQVQVAFVKQSSAVAETARLPFLRPYPAGVNIAETRTGAYLRSVEISGPFDPTGPGNSPSRQRIFTCHPTAVNASTPKDQLPTPKSAAGPERNRNADACARSILGSLARRAYRRPVASADIEPLMVFYREGASVSFDEGIDQALQRLLISPEFLLRVESDPAGVP